MKICILHEKVDSCKENECIAKRLHRVKILNVKILIAVMAISLFPSDPPLARAEDLPSSAVSAYIDTYYGVDSTNLRSHHRPYTTQAYHDEQPAVNLGYVDLSSTSGDYRGRIALQDGTSVEANYAAEPAEFWQYVQEATAGYRLGDDLWFDAGVQLSHIGMESFISRDNLNYTRYLVAEFSPYYQLAAKLSYKFGDALFGSINLMNGWQNISDNRNPAVGVKIAYTISPSVTATHNNYWSGNEPGTGMGGRFFNDFIVQWNSLEKFSVGIQGDIGVQERDAGNAVWHGWSAVGQYKIVPEVAIGARVERFSDPHGIVATSLSEGQFKVTGLSANVDVEIYPSLFCRTEYKSYLAKDAIFPNGKDLKDYEHLFVVSLSYTARKLL